MQRKTVQSNNHLETSYSYLIIYTFTHIILHSVTYFYIKIIQFVLNLYCGIIYSLATGSGVSAESMAPASVSISLSFP